MSMGSAGGALFTLKGVVRAYKPEPVAFKSNLGDDDDVLCIPRGGITGILGHSGCGKTTMLALLSLLDQADSGEIVFSPEPGTEIEYKDLYSDHRKRSVEVASRFGHIFQNDELLDHLSVEHNLQLRSWLRGFSRSRENLDTALKAVHVSRNGKPYLDKNPADLSVGERTRVGILRALLGEQHVIFADEPTASVDAAAEIDIMELLREWTRVDSRHSILLSTHRIDIAWKYCDRFLVLGSESGAVRVQQLCREDSAKEDRIPGSVPIGTAEELEKAVLAATPDKGVKSSTQTLPLGESSDSRAQIVWRLLKYDFWKHPRSDSKFLVERMSPLLYCLSFFVLVWFGGMVLGMRAGSAGDYEEKLADEFLWTTEMKGPGNKIGNLVTQGLVTGSGGFYRWMTGVYLFGVTDFSNHKSEQLLIGQTIEDDDPLMDRIGEALLWPPSKGGRNPGFDRFVGSEFGIILSSRALEEFLDYPSGEFPDRVAVRPRKGQQFWFPVLGVAAQLPNSADFLINVSTYAAVQQPEFASWLEPEKFHVRFRSDVRGLGSSEEQEAQLKRQVTTWLTGLDVEVAEAEWQTWNEERILAVTLSGPTRQFDLENQLTLRTDPVSEIFRGVVFPKELIPARPDRPYTRWNIGLPHDAEKVKAVIKSAYRLGIDVDTSVEARVDALHRGRSIFEGLAGILFGTVFVLGILLLFVSIWFDSLRKVHTVGVMLGLGVPRSALLIGYLLQMYIVLGALVFGYVIFDATGTNAVISSRIGAALFGSQYEMPYSAFSTHWLLFTVCILAVVPAIICLMRWRMYRYQPARLLGGS